MPSSLPLFYVPFSVHYTYDLNLIFDAVFGLTLLYNKFRNTILSPLPPTPESASGLGPTTFHVNYFRYHP